MTQTLRFGFLCLLCDSDRDTVIALHRLCPLSPHGAVRVWLAQAELNGLLTLEERDRICDNVW